MLLVEVQDAWSGPQFLQNVLPYILVHPVVGNCQLIYGVLFKVTYDIFNLFLAVHNQASLIAFPIPIDKMTMSYTEQVFRCLGNSLYIYLLLHNITPTISFIF